MAWARRASATRAANAGNPGASFNGGNLGAATVTGDRIIAVVDTSMVSAQTHVTGVTSTGGGGVKWSRDFIIQAFHNSYFEELAVWSGVCTADGSVTAITFALSPTMSASSGISCAIGAYSGLAVGLGLGVDQNGLQDIVQAGFADLFGGNVSYDSGVTQIAPNKPNLLVIGAHADAGNTSTLTAAGGFSVNVKTDVNSNGQCALQDKDLGAAGSPVRSTMTASVAGFDMSAVIVYRLLAGNTQPMARRPSIIRPGLSR
ncbi:MAG TPA: hypothetical protein VN654_05285 [Vicinamibacterales bacterium]|nr:hypothetical protein [Vicinamibacterales bacterium]